MAAVVAGELHKGVGGYVAGLATSVWFARGY